MTSHVGSIFASNDVDIWPELINLWQLSWSPYTRYNRIALYVDHPLKYKKVYKDRWSLNTSGLYHRFSYISGLLLLGTTYLFQTLVSLGRFWSWQYNCADSFQEYNDKQSQNYHHFIVGTEIYIEWPSNQLCTLNSHPSTEHMIVVNAAWDEKNIWSVENGNYFT